MSDIINDIQRTALFGLSPQEEKAWAQSQLNVALKEEQQSQGALSLAQAEVRRCREKLLEFVE